MKRNRRTNRIREKWEGLDKKAGPWKMGGRFYQLDRVQWEGKGLCVCVMGSCVTSPVTAFLHPSTPPSSAPPLSWTRRVFAPRPSLTTMPLSALVPPSSRLNPPAAESPFIPLHVCLSIFPGLIVPPRPPLLSVNPTCSPLYCTLLFVCLTEPAETKGPLWLNFN